MRKSIVVFGGSLFQDIMFEKNNFITTANQSLIRLSRFYRIDNFSMTGLTVERTYRLLKTLPISNLYSDCILALGEADLNDPLSFKIYLPKIIEHLQSNNIKPLLVSLPKEMLVSSAANQIQTIIDEVAIAHNVDYIYNGDTDKQVSYIVLDDMDMGKAIVELCN